MTLGLAQPLTETSTRRISWGKCGRCVELTALPTSCAVVIKSGNLNFLERSGPLQACNGTALPLPLLCEVKFIHMQSTVFCRMIYSQSYCEQLLSFKVTSLILSSGTQHVMTRNFMLHQSVISLY
jgi:hypothetical protein